MAVRWRNRRYLVGSWKAGLCQAHGWWILNIAQKPAFSLMGSPKWTVSPCISSNSPWTLTKLLHAENSQSDSFPSPSPSLLSKANTGDLTPNSLISGQSLYGSRSPALVLTFRSSLLLFHIPPYVHKRIHRTPLGLLQGMRRADWLQTGLTNPSLPSSVLQIWGSYCSPRCYGFLWR